MRQTVIVAAVVAISFSAVFSFAPGNIPSPQLIVTKVEVLKGPEQWELTIFGQNFDPQGQGKVVEVLIGTMEGTLEPLDVIGAADQMIMALVSPLTPGVYRLLVKNGPAATEFDLLEISIGLGVVGMCPDGQYLRGVNDGWDLVCEAVNGFGCPAGLTECGEGQCVDLNQDGANCGACGNVCGLDEICNGGNCQPIGSSSCTGDQDCPIGHFCGTADSCLPCVDADGDSFWFHGGSCGPEDCDDTDGGIHPGAIEFCDGIDNDCDPGTPDGSGDDWLGASCDGPDSDACANGIGICVDGLKLCEESVTNLSEFCDGIDNNCNGDVDEGPSSILCPYTAYVGGTLCTGSSGCEIFVCQNNHYDVDGVYSSGCECASRDSEPNDTLCTGVFSGELHDESGDQVSVEGNLPTTSDVDVFTFSAVDESASVFEDSFNVDVRFASNPGGVFRFSVYKGNSCAAASLMADHVLQWSEEGTYGPDDSAVYYVVVHYPGYPPPTCSDYRIQLSNGYY